MSHWHRVYRWIMALTRREASNIIVLGIVISVLPISSTITWFNETVCHFNIHSVQNWNSCKISMMSMTMVHSSCIVKRGWKWWYIRFLSHSRENSDKWYYHASNCDSWFHCAFSFIIGSTAIHMLAFRPSMNFCLWLGVSVIHTASLCFYRKVSFRLFQITSNMYCFNYPC